MSFPSDFDPGISMNIIQKGCFKHILGGKLYGTNTMGHVLCEVLITPKGLNPSDARPSLTLREFDANHG
jgi:hypothetical protein